MKMKFYMKKLRTFFLVFLGVATFTSMNAQIYADTTNLIADIEAGKFEEYILAPASVTDTFFLAEMISVTTDLVLKAQDGLGFKPVVAGNPDSKQSYLFSIENIDVGAEVILEGIHFVSEVNGDETINNGTSRILSENIDLIVIDCDFFDFPSYNAVTKIFNSGVNVTMENVLVYNCAGKIVQVNYKDDNSTPNYVPLMGDLTLKNSTFAKVYSRIFFELGAGDVPIDENNPDLKQRFNAGAENIFIDHCTFYGHEGVNVMQGRSLYEFINGQTAVKNVLSITNTIFSNMDNNLNADSASQTVFDYNYTAGFGVALAEGEVEDFVTEYGATNTIVTDPVFADTTLGAWDLTLQNEADLIGNDGTPIGDPRWWQGEWFPTSVEKTVLKKEFVDIYSARNLAVINTKENASGSISVFSITGQLVQKVNIRSQRTEIQLNKGLYIIKVETGLGSLARKVVISQ
ncbi:MAG: T9SS type A sorting domain-containing protein [Bacteroidales bacterium]|nr:T9SS type A sorting domain-containing protein [Bacteroidales bacterium]